MAQIENVAWAMAFLADLDEALDHLESDTRHMIEKQIGEGGLPDERARSATDQPH